MHLTAEPRSRASASDKPRSPTDPASLRRLDLPTLPAGPGRAAAPLVWLALASYLPRHSTRVTTWVSNARLAADTGLSVRAVERGIACLLAAGKISKRYGIRPGKYHRGRTITLNLLGAGANPCVRLPDRDHVAAMWLRARAVRDRPCTIVALAVAAFVWCVLEQGDAIGAVVGRPPVQALRALTGAAHGSTFTARLVDLEKAGVLRREGSRWSDGIRVRADGIRVRAGGHVDESVSDAYLSTLREDDRPEPRPTPRPALRVIESVSLPSPPMRVVRITNEASLHAVMAGW